MKKILFAITTIIILVAAAAILLQNHYLDGTALAKPFNALGFQPILDERYDFPEDLDVAYDPTAGIYYARNEILIAFFENVTDVEKKEVEALMKAQLNGETQDGYARMMIPAALSLEELKRLCSSMPTKSVCIEAAYVDQGQNGN